MLVLCGLDSSPVIWSISRWAQYSFNNHLLWLKVVNRVSEQMRYLLRWLFVLLVIKNVRILFMIFVKKFENHGVLLKLGVKDWSKCLLTLKAELSHEFHLHIGSLCILPKTKPTEATSLCFSHIFWVLNSIYSSSGIFLNFLIVCGRSAWAQSPLVTWLLILIAGQLVDFRRTRLTADGGRSCIICLNEAK